MISLTVTYVQYSDIQNELNASFDASTGTYNVFGIAVSQAAFQAHVDFANLYANSIVGQDLLTTDPRYTWAEMTAMNLACLRVLVAASGGLMLGGFDYRLGDLYVMKANVSKLAFTSAVQRYQADLTKTLLNFATPVVTADARAAGDVPTYRGGLISP
jgi:hypothetical protein